MHAGDLIEVSTPGGGGFGDPAQRAARAVQRDVAKGYYTCEQAREWFRVVFDAGGRVDERATALLRAKADAESLREPDSSRATARQRSEGVQ